MVKLTYGHGVSDLPRGARYDMREGRKVAKKFYRDWHNMLRRAYKDGGTYAGVSVCEAWKRLSAFKAWHDENYVEGYELDKDLKVEGSKVYAPDTCCYLPKEINMLFCTSEASRGGLPQGVSACKQTGMYKCRTRYKNKEVWIGRFRRLDEAVRAYNGVKLGISLDKLMRHQNKVPQEVYACVHRALLRKYRNEI